MEGSRPYGGVNNMQLAERYHQGLPPPPTHQMRSSYHSASFDGNGDWDTKKGRTGVPSRTWSVGDADIQRKKRVAGYKMYGVEGKVKGSFRKSFRWLKDRYSQVVYGWR